MLLLDTTEPTSEPEEIISTLRDVLAAMSPMRQLTSQEKRNFRKDLFEILESTLNVEPYWLDRPARRMGTLYEESSEVKFSFNLCLHGVCVSFWEYSTMKRKGDWESWILL